KKREKMEEAPDSAMPSTEVEGRRRNPVMPTKDTHGIPPDDTISRPGGRLPRLSRISRGAKP
ncbi:hypothetical protein U1Q18_024799, partial [Sarracenia purpurea var. burkii]